MQHVNNPVLSIGKYYLATTSKQEEGNLGTAIYVHNKIFYNKRVLNHEQLQISAISLQIDNDKFTLCNLYNQPNKNYNIDNLQTILRNFEEPLLIVGDFNAHNPIWDENCTAPDNIGRSVEHLMNLNNLCCLNDNETSTYFSKTHGTLSSIDITLCSSNIVDRFEWNISDDLYSSDHFPIVISYLNNNPSQHIPQYNIHKADWTMYEFHTRQILPFDSLKDHNETNNYVTDFMKRAADKSIPQSTPHPNKNKVPWWSDTLSELVKQKHTVGRRLDSLHRRFSKINKVQQLQEKNLQKMITILLEIDTLKPFYNKLCAKFRKGVIQGKILSWKQYISTITSNTPIKKIWHKFRKINGTFTNPPRHAIIQNGNKFFDPQEVSNLLAKNFANISSVNSLDEHFRKIKSKAEVKQLNFETIADIYYNRSFSMDELDHALASCNDSAPGRDNICFEMIRKLAPTAKSFLLQFYNHIWLKNLFPEEWRKAIIIPILKPGKDPSNVTNYRPISLTSCLCKLLEKMINFRLAWFIQKNKVLTPTQFGSQNNRSTIDSLSHLEDHIRRGFERKQLTIAIFFDIQKAYDTTWRYSILKSLYDNNLRGHLPIFIRNFLSNRSFQVRLDNVYSDSYSLEIGIPQGSVLSGTLFTLAINSIASQLPHGIKNNLYMDDFAMYYTVSNLRHAERILNTAIKKIDTWASSVGFQFSVEKTKAIIFYRDIRWKKGEEIELKIRNHVIPISESVKFLGLVFDTHLNWKTHVAYIKGKAKNSLNLLKKLSHTTWGADRSTLMALYKTTVLSILDYGSQIYGSASEATLKTLDPIHNEGLRICTGAFKSSPNMSVQVESGEPPLSLHRDLVTMKSAVRIKASDSPTKKLFNERDIFINNHPPPFAVRANRLIESTNINLIYPPLINLPPPWIMHKVKVCTHLYYLSKRYGYSSEHHRQHTIEHIKRKGNHYALYTDGSKSHTGVGFAAVSISKTIQYSLPNNATVFTAELAAIFSAVKIVKNLPQQNFVIFSDSRSAIEALKNYMPRNPLVQQIKISLHKLYEAGVNIEICWIPAHIGVKGNEDADKAAKAATTMTRSNIKIPVSDFLPSLKTNIFNRWQSLWNDESENNKLKQIKPNVGLWHSSLQKMRTIEVILSRLRIGHTRLTHGYLMNSPHEPAPECRDCRTTLTIKHILCDCQKYQQPRAINFGNNSLSEILSESSNFSFYPIIKFLKNCNLLDKI